MRAAVGVTDSGWARFLAARPELTEANFWVPSGLPTFSVITSGEPFLFRTKKPDYALVGGGFLSEARNLPLSTAWNAFGEGNGVSSHEELLATITRYRERNRLAPEPEPDPSSAACC